MKLYVVMWINACARYRDLSHEASARGSILYILTSQLQMHSDYLKFGRKILFRILYRSASPTSQVVSKNIVIYENVDGSFGKTNIIAYIIIRYNNEAYCVPRSRISVQWI